LGAASPVRFALVDAGGSGISENVPLELTLHFGDRLKITRGVDATTLRTVLSF
jgi:hypothetical protein